MIRLRNARQDELESLSELCLRSKGVWGYDPTFMAACRAELTLQPAELEPTHLQVAEVDSVALGVVQIKVTGEDAHLLKLFVEPNRLRSGIGRLLLGWASERARSLGALRMNIEADPNAVPFYRRSGARLAGSAPSGSIPGRMLPLLILNLQRGFELPR